MCNIAGYAGNRQAALILLEMLRRQQPYDGDMSTGIAVIHEGKLFWRAVVGDVDALIRQTDVLSLPGTLGIAHTRPGGSAEFPPMHPSISRNGKMALVTNGTTPVTQYSPGWSDAVNMLDGDGYRFVHEGEGDPGVHPFLRRNGNRVSPAEARVFLVEYYMERGKTLTEALALACAHMYSDNISVMISETCPDSIFALRTTRPMTVVTEKGETYMATTRFGMPEGLGEKAVDLPLFYACRIGADGYTVTGDKMQAEPVAEMTPYAYGEAHRRFEMLLKSEKAPLNFDGLELAANAMRDIWEGDHTCVQHARLVYDILWQLDREGRLKREMRLQNTRFGPRHRWYFSLQ